MGGWGEGKGVKSWVALGGIKLCFTVCLLKRRILVADGQTKCLKNSALQSCRVANFNSVDSLSAEKIGQEKGL